MTPSVVILPIFPSVVVAFGKPEVAVRARCDVRGITVGLGVGNSVTTPAVVIRPILLCPRSSVNQRLPSGPAVMPSGPLAAVGIGNSVMT